jgi:hypothetical protein
MKEALSSFETSVLTRAARRNIPEDGVVENKLICNWRKINKSLVHERKSLFLNFVLLPSIVRIFKFELLVILMKEALSSFETTVLTRAARCNISEDTILRILNSFAHLWCVKIDSNVCRNTRMLDDSKGQRVGEAYVFEQTSANHR